MESSDSHPSSLRTAAFAATNLPATRPILKRKTVESKREKRAGIMWDEVNLMLNDEEKSLTTRMKIDEPKTPYNRENFSDEESNSMSESGHSPVAGLKWTELEHAMLKAAETQNEIESPSCSGSDFEGGAESSSESESEFKERRKSHYDEYQTLVKWRQKQQQADEDEEADDIISKRSDSRRTTTSAMPPHVTVSTPSKTSMDQT